MSHDARTRIARFVQADDDRWVWLIVGDGGAGLEVKSGDIIAVSGQRFDTLKQAQDDLLTVTGGTMGITKQVWPKW